MTNGGWQPVNPYTGIPVPPTNPWWHIPINAVSDEQSGVTMKNIKKTPSWIEKGEDLSRLIGAPLTSVQFVLNYLILGFDPKGALTTLVWPELCHDNKKVTFGTDGYRDELCSLIDKVVTNATMDSDETIIIDFENGVEVRIPLQSYKAPGERAILTGPKRFLLVF